MNDDERPYIGASGLGGKRHATDKAEGDGRVKRKRVDATATASIANANGAGAAQGSRRGLEGEEESRDSLVSVFVSCVFRGGVAGTES